MSRESPNPADVNKNGKKTLRLENDEEIRVLLSRRDDVDFISNLILDVSNANFFHGSICADEASENLKSDGEFLLRTPCDTTTNHPIMLAVYWKGRVLEFPLRFSKSDGQPPIISINGTQFKGTIQDLLKEHSDVPIEGSIRLGRPFSKINWQLPLENIELNTKIGEGAFGSVWKGRLKDPRTSSERNVAIKVTKECDITKRNEIQAEARLMSQLNHTNVVGFYGVAVNSLQVMIVMELVDGGSLDKYLRKNSDVCTDGDRGSFCFDVASGLRYLHAKHYLHRDVACRNCLINEGTQIVKLSDFGMSKYGITYKITATERTPIRWQAPEVMRTAMYSIKCDVYSYGMTMYEIFSGGEVPFVGIDKKVIRQKINEPSFRPHIQEDWPVEVRVVMQYCWHHQPDIRPTMDAICSVLKIFSRNRPSKSNSKESPAKEQKTKTVRSKRTKAETKKSQWSKIKNKVGSQRRTNSRE